MNKLILYLQGGWIRYPSPPPGLIYKSQNIRKIRTEMDLCDALFDGRSITIHSRNRNSDILAIIRARNRGRPLIRDGSQIGEANPRGKPKETIYSRGAPGGTPESRSKSRGDPRGDPSGDIRAGTPPNLKMVT